jgi:arginine decarboxylase
MIPSPQHIIIDLDEEGNLTDRLLAPKQSAESMLKILGY